MSSVRSTSITISTIVFTNVVILWFIQYVHFPFQNMCYFNVDYWDVSCTFCLTCSHSRDFSLSVQDVILDNLGSLHCCHVVTWSLISGVIGNLYLNCINFHIEFDNIHVIYLLTCWLLSSKSMTNVIHNMVTYKRQTIMPHPLNM